MKNVTGPISIGVGPQQRRPQASQPGANPGSQPNASEGNTQAEPGVPTEPGVVRNISFRGIQATVVVPQQFADVPFTSGYNPGEIKSCIALNSVEGLLENISFNDVHVKFPGGGTREEAAVRDVPKIVGEYYQAGVFPSYALYARNVRALTMNNIRFELEGTQPEARPAVVFDHVNDATINGFSVQGTKEAESLLRFIETKEVLLTASRVLAPSSVFLQVEGGGSQAITIDGGDISKAATPLAFTAGAQKNSVKLRV
jgi:hypothetical protein